MFEDVRRLENFERVRCRIITVLFFLRALRNSILKKSFKNENSRFALEIVSLYLLRNLDFILNARDAILDKQEFKKSCLKTVKRFLRINKS